MLIELFDKPVGFFLLIMVVILITPMLSERVRLPGIIGIIIGGMLIGPHGFGLVQDGERMQFLSTIGVVGAFLAGFAVNSMLPRHSPVAGHVLFIGESFFIPMFLLYSGLITNPLSFLSSPQTIVIAAGVTVVA